MDIKEFKKNHQPGKRKSKLDKIYNELLQLQSEGYSLGDMKKFAEANGIKITVQSISEFLSRRKRLLQATPTESRPALEGNNQSIEEVKDKPKNVTRFVDPDKLNRIKNHKRGDK